MQHLHCPMEIKEVTETGTFEGLASVYGNVDLGGDICMPGCFKEFVKTRDGSIRILDSHNTRAPIGKGTVIDSHMGLVLKGTLNLKVSRSRDVHELMKDGIIDGLSIGFDILPNGSEVRESDNVRLLKELKLWEISTVVFPMNPAATISAVKNFQQITNIREYENWLRDAGGFSKEQAKILARSYKDLPGRRDADETAEQSKELLGFLERIAAGNV